MRGLAAAQRHYDNMLPEYDDEYDDEREGAIAAAVIDSMLMGGEYDPTDSGNINEALGEQEPAFYIALSKLLRMKNYQGVGIALESASHEYWLKVAEYQAEENYQGR